MRCEKKNMYDEYDGLDAHKCLVIVNVKAFVNKK